MLIDQPYSLFNIYCTHIKKRYNFVKFGFGSWWESNTAHATVFLSDKSDTSQIVLLNTTMGGELRHYQ